MIVELSVSNFAIIEGAQIHLGPGFTALTGETGAGKSLLIDAIELALGGRADTDHVRTGATRAVVALTLDLSSNKPLQQRCADLGISLDDGLLFIQREVFAEGRSQARIGGRMAPIGALKQLGESLVDLHGQHDHQSLLLPERHGAYLDAWIGPEAGILLSGVRTAFEEADNAKRKLAQLRSGIREREQRLDMLRFQVEEIEAVSPVVGELEELEGRLSRLRNVEKLSNAVMAALQDLTDKEGCAVDALGNAVRSLEDMLRYDTSLEAPLAELKNALYAAEEGVRGLRANAETLESDPEALEESAARMDALKRLRKKYGEDEGAVLGFLHRARAELDLLEGAEENQEEMEKQVARLEEVLRNKCDALTKLRKKHAERFAEGVAEQLRELAMEKARFSVAVEPKTIEVDGADAIEFFFSANAGETPRPLARIASGGEISRVMLGLKTVLAGRAGVPTLIFDEVDAGLGGRAAAVVAKKLEELAAAYQVIVISHLPQIASRAGTHYHISKTEEAGRVRTNIDHLDGESRVEEIARMLAGEHVSATALANARELLSQ